MTRETKTEVIITALAVSALIHVVVMAYARPKVMTSVASGGTGRAIVAPMRVSKAIEKPEPVRIDAVKDVEALAASPDVEVPGASVPLPSEAPDVMPVSVQAAVSSVAAAPLADGVAPPVFDAKPPSMDSSVSAKIPMAKIEVPAAVGVPTVPVPATPASAPGGLPHGAADLPIPSVGTDPGSPFLPSELAVAMIPKERAKPVFVPAAEVYEKVDEKVVEAEKAAVKELVESEDAEDLPKFVNAAMTRCVDGEWEYFRIMISPRSTLPIVSKDVVLVLDASGSIGSDRIVSIRKAAKRLLRSATNSGDRFNLVAFRNRFSYAFKAWQPCSQGSFDRADKWLGNLAAHGRTDVFATISSVLTLPRDPKRPLIALVVTDGDANAGVSENAEIISKFTALNDGLISVYMYGVKASANRELIEVLTRGNRGEGLVFDGSRSRAGDEIDVLAERFRDPVLSDLRVIFAADTKAESYPRVLPNLSSGGTVEIVGRVPAGTQKVSFAVRGLNGAQAYEGFFTMSMETSPSDPSLPSAWRTEAEIDRKLR